MNPKAAPASKQLAAFQRWLAEAGVTVSDCCQLCSNAAGCSGLALGVRASKDIAVNDLLATIPKAACLSIRTSAGVADIIEQEQLGGGLGLVLAVLYELSLGPQSTWHGYFQALPPREYLPALWTDEELALLEGTELAGRVQSDRLLMAADFEEQIVPLLERYPGRLGQAAATFFTLENFSVAASFVASRAFGIDDYHGDAMVPVADIFNHKCSVVELDPAYAVHGMSDSEEEGSEGEEGEEQEEGEEGEGSEEESGSEAEQGSGADMHAHGSRHRRSTAAAAAAAEEEHKEEEEREEEEREAELPTVLSNGQHSRYGLTQANGLHLRLEIAIVDKDEELHIVAASAVPAGQEVHNTYGEHGNHELVSKYGFALRENPFTAVSLDQEALISTAQAALGQRALRQRCRSLRLHTQVLARDEDGDKLEPFEALPNGHISPALFVALRALCARADEVEAWQGIGDALALPGGQQLEVHAVQIWPVLTEAGKMQPEAAAEAAMAAAQQHGAGSLSQLVDSRMCELLKAVAQQRLERYPTCLRDSVAALAQARRAAAASGRPLSEHESATQAALLLRVTEQEILEDLVLAATARQAWLGPCSSTGSSKGSGGGRKRRSMAKDKAPAKAARAGKRKTRT